MAGGGSVLYPQLDAGRRDRPISLIVWVLGVGDDALAGADGRAQPARSSPWAQL